MAKHLKSSFFYHIFVASMLIAVLCLVMPILSATTLEEYAKDWYDAKTIQTLKKGKTVGRSFDQELKYLPRQSEHISNDITQDESDIHMEFLSFVPFEKGSLSKTGQKRDTLWMLNSFLQSKKMTEAVYYSNKDKKYKPLFSKAGRIKNPRSRRILSDLQYDYLPKKGRQFLLIDMDKLGEIVLDVRAAVQKDRIDVDMYNPQPVKVAIFTFARSKNLQIKVVCEKLDDGILIYEVCQIIKPGTQVLNFLGLGDRLNGSMFARFKGITTWVHKQLL